MPAPPATGLGGSSGGVYPYGAINAEQIWLDTGPANILFAPLNLSGTSSQSVIAGVAGKKIRVLGIYGVLAGTSPTLTWQTQTGPTALTGAMNPASGTVINDPPTMPPFGKFETNAGDGLFAQLGGTSPTLNGYLVYCLH